MERAREGERTRKRGDEALVQNVSGSIDIASIPRSRLSEGNSGPPTSKIEN
jgi:hypothetical protein